MQPYNHGYCARIALQWLIGDHGRLGNGPLTWTLKILATRDLQRSTCSIQQGLVGALLDRERKQYGPSVCLGGLALPKILAILMPDCASQAKSWSAFRWVPCCLNLIIKRWHSHAGCRSITEQVRGRSNRPSLHTGVSKVPRELPI